MKSNSNKIEFKNTCYVSKNEIKKVIDCLKSNQWSSFKGATEGWNIDDCIQLTSKEANKIPALGVRFLGGKYVRKLEYNISKKFKISYAVTANSATSALVMAVGSLDINPGDEIIVPSMSYIASATCVLSFSAIPIFCEVKDDTYCLDPNDFEKKITKRTKAVIVVHLGGAVSDMKKILKIAKKHKIKVIEDAAQSPGVKYQNHFVGTIGDIGIFSFTETKTITSGEGGVLLTNNPQYAKKARLIRNHGESVTKSSWKKKDLINIVGMNFRLTEIQAVILIEQLKDLDNRNRLRRKNYIYLKKKLSNLGCLIFPKTEKESVYIPYIIKWQWDKKKFKISRDDIVKECEKINIPITAGYKKMMHENQIFLKKIAFGSNNYPWAINKKITYKYGKKTLPISENINKRFLWFKYINPPNSKKQMDYLINSLNNIIKKLTYR